MGCPVEPDKYQQAWHAQSSQRRVSVDADLLRKEVQRNQRNFRAVIFARDRRELIVALLLICVWFCLGFTIPLPWTWWLTVPVLVWMAGFMLVYRKRHQPRPNEPDEPLLYCVKNSLADVEAQIWLLRNIFWWYLLPPLLSISAFFVDVGWRVRALGWLPSLGFSGLLVAMVAVLYAGLYFVNQYAVDSQLESRRRELLALFASLADETTSEVSGGYPILMGAEHVARSRWRMVLCFVAAVVILVAGLVLVPVFMRSLEPWHEYPWKSPFAAVQWQESQPEVKVGDEWFKLVSLDGIPASEIVAFSQRTYGKKWQMRFEEDLVELLTAMGHPPKDTVTLVVQSLTSPETRTLEDVPMTEANRRAIKRAAMARQRSRP